MRTSWHLSTLAELAQRMAQSSISEFTREFVRQTDIEVCPATVGKALKKAGIRRVRPARHAGTRAAAQSAAPQRYGLAV
ncbi:MAG: hypothetical protein LBE78_11800 [Burkholderiaceae bacterium]|nr:hypothetical protein [Burkholderiaceae bacterium]